MYWTSSVYLCLGVPAVLAQTFNGFTPSVATQLIVEFVGSGTGSDFISPNQRNLPASRVSAPPLVGLKGTVNTKNHVLMMVDADAVVNANGTKTTIMHYFQTDLNITSSASNYTRLAAPSNIPAVETYLKPGSPAGQIHRYSLLLFVQPTNLTKDIVDTALTTVSGSAAGDKRAGFDVKKFMTLTGMATPIAAAVFQFGNGTVPTGGGLNLNNGTTPFLGQAEEVKASKWAIVALLVALIGLL